MHFRTCQLTDAQEAALLDARGLARTEREIKPIGLILVCEALQLLGRYQYRASWLGRADLPSLEELIRKTINMRRKHAFLAYLRKTKGRHAAAKMAVPTSINPWPHAAVVRLSEQCGRERMLTLRNRRVYAATYLQKEQLKETGNRLHQMLGAADGLCAYSDSQSGIFHKLPSSYWFSSGAGISIGTGLVNGFGRAAGARIYVRDEPLLKLLYPEPARESAMETAASAVSSTTPTGAANPLRTAPGSPPLSDAVADSNRSDEAEQVVPSANNASLKALQGCIDSLIREYEGKTPPQQSVLLEVIRCRLAPATVTRNRMRDAIKGTTLHTSKTGPRD